MTSIFKSGKQKAHKKLTNLIMEMKAEQSNSVSKRENDLGILMANNTGMNMRNTRKLLKKIVNTFLKCSQVTIA